jgi:hypothetical protein
MWVCHQKLGFIAVATLRFKAEPEIAQNSSCEMDKRTLMNVRER